MINDDIMKYEIVLELGFMDKVGECGWVGFIVKEVGRIGGMFILCKKRFKKIVEE